MHLQNTSIRAIKFIAEATGELISNKSSDKITKVSRTSPQNNLLAVDSEIELPKERYISPEKRQKTIDSLILI